MFLIVDFEKSDIENDASDAYEDFVLVSEP